MQNLELLQGLLYASHSEEPFEGLVQHLARECAGSAIIFDTDHTVIAVAGSAPKYLVREKLVDIEAAGDVVALGRWFVAARSVGVRAQTYFVVLAGRDQKLLEKLAENAFDALAALLGSVAAIEGTSLAQRAISSVKTIQDLEVGILVSQEPSFWRRLERFGYEPFRNVQIMICEKPVTQQAFAGRVDETLKMIRRFVDDKPVVVAESSMESWQFLIPEGALVSALSRIVTHTFVTAVSEPFVSLSIYPEMYRATKIALRHAGRKMGTDQPQPDHLVTVAEMSPIDWMVSASADRLDMAVVSRYGAVLRDDEVLLTSLLEYLAAQLDVGRAANSLNVHPNTLRYRLQKTERRLGGSLADPWTISNLCLTFYDELQAQVDDIG